MALIAISLALSVYWVLEVITDSVSILKVKEKTITIDENNIGASYVQNNLWFTIIHFYNIAIEILDFSLLLHI